MPEVAHTHRNQDQYPGYINVTALDDGRVKITVRASQLKGPGEHDVAREGEIAVLVMEQADWNHLVIEVLSLPLAVPAATHESDAIVVSDGVEMSDEEAMQIADDKHAAQMADLTPEDER